MKSGDSENKAEDQQKKIEELEKTIALYRKILENLPVGVQVFDEKGVSYEINAKQQELLGLPDTTTGVGEFNVLKDPYAEASGASKIYEKAYKGEKHSHQLEYDLGSEENVWNTHKEKRFFNEDIIPLRVNKDTVDFVLAVLSDVTKEKYTQEQLKDSEYRWRFAIEGNSDGLWDWNMETNEVFFSAQWKAMLGYEEDEIGTGLDEWDKRVHPDDKEQAYKDIQDHIEGRTDKYVNEHRVLCKDGSYKWILDRGKIIERKENGEPLRMIGTHSDITERKEAENLIAQNLKRFNFLNSATLDMLKLDSLEAIYEYVTDMLAGQLPDTLILFNVVDEAKNTSRVIKMRGIQSKLLEKASKKLGYTPFSKTYENTPATLELFKTGRLIEFKGGLNELAGESINQSILKSIEKLLSVNRVYTIGIRGDENLFNTIHFFSLRDSYIKDTEFIETFVHLSSLIIQKKKLEDQLKDNEQELIQSNKQKDRFFSIIAHDLKGPYSGLLGISELLIQNFYDEDLESMKSNIELFNSSLKQSYTLLENLLHWSRFQTNRLVFSPKQLSAKDLVDRVLQHFELQYTSKNITIQTSIEPGLSIYADEFMMETILRNLISNALKYSYKNGSIHIKADSQKKGAEFIIEDEGMGIAKERLKDLFTLETMHTEAGTDNEKGTGLGLILCKEFVEKHGGEIHAESKEGKFTRFTFTIRIESQDVSPQDL